MPELPEVETFVRQLRPLLLGQKISNLHVHEKGLRMISPPDPLLFIKQVTNLTILGLTRQGKFIIMQLENFNQIVIHLRMSGRLIISKTILEHTHNRLSLEFASGSFLNFIDIRRFGTFHLSKPKTYLPLKKIGPDALSELNVTALFNKVTKRDKAVYKLLLDQNFIAGIGNIYANEALFDAGINPLRNTKKLKKHELEKLLKSVRNIMQRAIKMKGTTLIDRSYKDSKNENGKFIKMLKVYGRKGKKCVNCQSDIKNLKVGGRSVFFCSKCQK